MENVKQRIDARKILENTSLNDDEKLLLVFRLYQENLCGTQLYYAFLAWKDSHIKELRHLL